MLPPCRAWNDLHRRSAGAEDFAAMAKRSDEDLFQILIGQIRQDREIYIIISKALGILGHAELFEPVRHLLHRLPPCRLTGNLRSQELTNNRHGLVGRLYC
jgi:hypothetical protein